MRRFSADYLRHTRGGLWADRTALDPLDLPTRERVVDVGAGTGALTRVLDEETPAGTPVVAVDADADLLASARDAGHPTVRGDATRLPLRDGAVDLVACQALFVNLPDEARTRAVAEFVRASTDLVAAVEPDNANVAVESTVDAEVELERRARAAYMAGVETDVSPGDAVADLFRDAGLEVVATRRHYHEKRVEPPYDDRAVRSATRKASGAGLADHERELRRALGDDYDDLRDRWRAMGRAVVDRMDAGTYRRVEVVPFDVTVGRVTE